MVEIKRLTKFRKNKRNWMQISSKREISLMTSWLRLRESTMIKPLMKKVAANLKKTKSNMLTLLSKPWMVKNTQWKPMRITTPSATNIVAAAVKMMIWRPSGDFTSSRECLILMNLVLPPISYGRTSAIVDSKEVWENASTQFSPFLSSWVLWSVQLSWCQEWKNLQNNSTQT